MSDNVMFWVLIVAMLLVSWVLPQYLTAKTAPKVIRLFREHKAIGAENAATAESLGLVRPAFGLLRLGRRDYRPKALQLLVKMEVVKSDDEGRVYLCEQGLARTVWNNR